MPDESTHARMLQLTAQIVSAHLGNNNVASEALPALINSVYASLSGAGHVAAEPVRPEPAVPVKKSVFAEYIICLEDGKKLKMLKRHLATSYDLTPEQYRARWGLASDYPMVAPNYAARRSELAKTIGLGRKPAAAPMPKPVVAPVKLGRKPKA